MSRKLVFCVVSAFALMSVVVSAQQPPPADRGPGELVKPNPRVTVTQSLPSTDDEDEDAPGAHNPYWSNGITLWNGPMHLNQAEMRLAQESKKLVEALAKAEGDKKDKIKTQLTETLGKQFDARQKRHEAEIARLEAQIKKLKEMVQKRQDNRREIISRRYEQLVREAEGLGW